MANIRGKHKKNNNEISVFLGQEAVEKAFLKEFGIKNHYICLTVIPQL